MPDEIKDEGLGKEQAQELVNFLTPIKTELDEIATKSMKLKAESASIYKEYTDKKEEIPADKMETLLKMRDEIKSYDDEFTKKNEQYQLLMPVTKAAEIKAWELDNENTPASSADRDEVKSFVTELRAKFAEIKPSGSNKKSIGAMWHDVFKANKVGNFTQIPDTGMKMTVHYGDDSMDAAKEQFGAEFEKAEVKSLYVNNNVQFGSVPGQVGYCGVMDDPYFCPWIIPEDDFEQCLTNANLTSGVLRYRRLGAYENNAASVPETIYSSYPGTIARNGLKPESTFSMLYAELTPSKIAHRLSASDESLEDCSYLVDLIDNFLTVFLEREKRRQLIAGNPAVVATNMRGILYQPGTISRIHKTDGETTDNIYDTFRRTMTDLYFQGADTSRLCVIMNARDVETLDLTKDTQGRYLFNDGMNGQDCVSRQIRCFKLTTSVDMPEGQAVVGELMNNWMFYLRRALEMKVGMVGNQMIENMQTFLAEMRGLTFLRCPSRVAIITGL